MILDESDGLDWPTLCKCDVIYAVPRSDCERRRENPFRRRFENPMGAAHPRVAEGVTKPLEAVRVDLSF